MEPLLETPPLEVIGQEHPDALRAKALSDLMLSPEVEVIGRMLANIARKQAGLMPILRLENLEPEETAHYREHAVMAIRMLDREQVDEAIYAAAKMFGLKVYDAFEGLSAHKQGFCVWVSRAICQTFKHTLGGYTPLSGDEARGWKSLEKRMDSKRELVKL